MDFQVKIPYHLYQFLYLWFCVFHIRQDTPTQTIPQDLCTCCSFCLISFPWKRLFRLLIIQIPTQMSSPPRDLSYYPKQNSSPHHYLPTLPNLPYLQHLFGPGIVLLVYSCACLSIDFLHQIQVLFLQALRLSHSLLYSGYLKRYLTHESAQGISDI